MQKPSGRLQRLNEAPLLNVICEAMGMSVPTPPQAATPKPTTEDIVPYCGVVFGLPVGRVGLIGAVIKVKSRLQQDMNMHWLSHDSDWALDGGRFITVFFKYDHPPHWAPNSGINETTYGYFTLGLTNGYFVFHCSSNDVKEAVLDLLDSNTFPIDRVSREVLNYAFIVKKEIKTIWLHGIHKKTAVKADSKALTGTDLRQAFDPSADQSYSYNSLRGSVRIEKKDRTFGVNLSEAYVWLYKLNSWRDFLEKCDALTTILMNARGRVSSAPLDTVSHPIRDLGLMKAAYDFSIYDPDSQLAPNLGDVKVALLRTIKADYEFDVPPNLIQDNVVRVRVHHLDNGLRSYVGDIAAEPIIQSERLRFDTTIVNAQPGQIGKVREFERIFRHPTLVQAWYESGHAITGGGCYEVNYKSAPFNGIFWASFPNTNILKEKPLPPANGTFLSNIGSLGEDSLFSWVYRALKRGTNNERLAHLRMASSNDWLLCDDGSGEVSDFVHATTHSNVHHLTLIHVKAANSSQVTRLISVSAHDIVINQAIKNIGSLTKTSIVTTLSQRISHASSKPAWSVVNGAVIPVAASSFVSHLNTWSSGRVRCHVIVVQPHTLRTVFRNKTNSRQHEQLCTLLNSAAHQVAGLGGTFTLVASRS